jgi:hypothetical protein
MKPIQTLPSLFAIGLTAAATAAMAETTLQHPHAVVVENIVGADFPATLAVLKAQLAADDWILLSEIDPGSSIARHGGGTPLPGGLVILELSRSDAPLQVREAAATRRAGDMVPCRLTVYGTADGRGRVSRTPAAVIQGTMPPQLAQQISEASARLDASIGAALARV